jgi:hypothetical protein
MNELPEDELIELAENQNNDIANAAMNELRRRFDASYVWCPCLDYAVVKKDECERMFEAERSQTGIDAPKMDETIPDSTQ